MASSKRGSQKRNLVKAPNATFFAKRGPKGRFKEMDEIGRSLAADRRQKRRPKRSRDTEIAATGQGPRRK